MEDKEMRGRLIAVTAIAARFCNELQNVAETTKKDFVNSILSQLPRLYWEFFDLSVEENEETDYYLQEYVDEDYYEQIRRQVENLLGADDIFLETFEEDMKYSDTPISASISECLADIFQALYNFVSAVKESDGDLLVEAYSLCRQNFVTYWAQTLCNVMRSLNALCFSEGFGEEEE